MADVEVVIKIDEEIYQEVVNGRWRNGLLGALCTGVENGKPLPKGHGDIVDIEHLARMFWDGNSMEITKSDLSMIEPIIAADRPGNKEADSIRPKAGTPREDYEPEYDCEDWIP